jgi:hypothetical protein
MQLEHMSDAEIFGEFVAEMLLVERDGKYLVDHAMVF